MPLKFKTSMDRLSITRLDKKGNPMQKRWRCLICGYIHVGEEPPYVCPICNAPRKMFELIGGDDPPTPEH
jgi:rubrerythrin